MVPPSLLKPLRHYRMYSGADGVSLMERVEVPRRLAEAAPPAPPLLLSEFAKASRVGFYSLPAGWFGDWHPAPTRQFMVLLSGEMEVETGDGELTRLHPGEVILVEDTEGRGHTSRNVSGEDCHFLVTQLPEKA